jgi:hypothetical protein
MRSRDDLRDGEKKVERFLTFLAQEKDVAPSTQNQALNALGEKGVRTYRHYGFDKGSRGISPSQYALRMTQSVAFRIGANP